MRGHIVSSSSVNVVSPNLSIILEEMQLDLDPESKRHRNVSNPFLVKTFTKTVGSNVVQFCLKMAERVAFGDVNVGVGVGETFDFAGDLILCFGLVGKSDFDEDLEVEFSLELTCSNE